MWKFSTHKVFIFYIIAPVHGFVLTNSFEFKKKNCLYNNKKTGVASNWLCLLECFSKLEVVVDQEPVSLQFIKLKTRTATYESKQSCAKSSKGNKVRLNKTLKGTLTPLFVMWCLIFNRVAEVTVWTTTRKEIALNSYFLTHSKRTWLIASKSKQTFRILTLPAQALMQLHIQNSTSFKHASRLWQLKWLLNKANKNTCKVNLNRVSFWRWPRLSVHNQAFDRLNI